MKFFFLFLSAVAALPLTFKGDDGRIISKSSLICTRTVDGNSIMYYCSDLGLTKIPSDIPRDTTYFNAYNNDIDVISTSSFLGLKALKEIRLGLNKITCLVAGLFVDQEDSLQALSLFGNLLTF